MSESIAERAQVLRGKIDKAADRADRDPGSICLLPASKKQDAETLRGAMEAGFNRFGENRVQEALAKMDLLPQSVQWDFIGGLQRNKVKNVVGAFGLIHSVDSLKLAQEIEKRAVTAGVIQKVLLEINIGGEAAKHGATIEEAPDLAGEINQLEHVEIHGLMCVAPFREDLQLVRPYFVTMRELRDRIEDEKQLGLPELSMGMSHDFEVAIAEGATIIRVGTALFGERR